SVDPRATASRTQECSTAVVTTCPSPEPVRDPARASAPATAVLTASVPDDVNTTSRGRAPKKDATCSRAVSSAIRVARPSACKRPGSPNEDSRYGRIAAYAAARSGEVEA